MVTTQPGIVLSRPQTKVNRSRAALTLDMAGQRAGKSQMIGIITGQYINLYPKLKGFVAANTYLQLTQSTLVKVFEIWREVYHMREYNSKTNPAGHYVVDKRPPSHFKTNETFKDYNNIISFWNGHMIYVGSLDNYKAHDGKEFAYAHLDETKDTKEIAVTSVILARLSLRGLFVHDGEFAIEWNDSYKGGNKETYLVEQNQIVYIPDFNTRADDIDKAGFRSFNPCWIHTSPAIGQVDWLIKMFRLDEMEPDIRRAITGVTPEGNHDFFYYNDGERCVVIFSTFHNEKNLPKTYIPGRIAVLTENEQLKFIYGYPFSKTGGEYYTYFERLKHVRRVDFLPALSIHTAWDFNVTPYMTCVCAQIQYVERYIDSEGRKHLQYREGRKFVEVMQIRVYAEYCLASPQNTVEEVAKEFKEDHKNEPNNGIYYHGDHSGLNRIPGLGSLTNYRQVEMYLAKYIHSNSRRVWGKDVGGLIRRELVQKLLAGKIPNAEIYIDESCVMTIKDFEYLKMGENGKLKEKVKDKATGTVYEKLGHTTDALEDLICDILKAHLKLDTAEG